MLPVRSAAHGHADGAVVVGVPGLEPGAFRSQSGRATKLRHTPQHPRSRIRDARRLVRAPGYSRRPAPAECWRDGLGGTPERLPCLTKPEAAPRRAPARSCGCSSMAELQPSKLVMRVRFPSPAPPLPRGSAGRTPVLCRRAPPTWNGTPRRAASTRQPARRHHARLPQTGTVYDEATAWSHHAPHTAAS